MGDVVGSGSRPTPRRDATDTTGTVRVLMDERGQVTDVDIDQRWRSRLTPEELVAALFDTYYAARVRAAETNRDLASSSEGHARLRSLGPGADHAERWRRIDDMLAEHRAAREQRNRILAELREPRDHVGPNGYLTATLQWGAVIGLSGDPRQVGRASTEILRQDALALLSLANRSLAERRKSTHSEEA